MGYNGYCNRETWLWNLCHGDDTEWLIDIVNSCSGDIDNVADSLEYFTQEMYRDSIASLPSFIAELLAMNQINWRELAELYVEDYWIKPSEDEDEIELESI